MEHQHKYLAGAARGKQVFRFCSIPGCKHVLWYYGTNKPESRQNDDVEYYREMARKYGL